MKITFHPFGDQALLLQWEQRIDPAINAEVIRLNQAIGSEQIQGVQYAIPAYCSLTIAYRPELIDYQSLCERIQALVNRKDLLQKVVSKNRQVVIPVCYEGEYAPDLKWLSQQIGLSTRQIIQLHTGTLFRVFMLGFMPGFPYLGTLPQALEAPRKTTPRLRVPAGSVAVAGLQTGIYPTASPGGWQIIGRTPRKIFDPEREEPFLLSAGDEVRFEAISPGEFKKPIK